MAEHFLLAAKLVVECLGGLEAMAIIPVALPLQRSRAVRSPQRPSIMSLTSWAGSQGPLMFNHAVLRRPASCFGRRIRSRLPRRDSTPGCIDATCVYRELHPYILIDY